VVVAAEEAGVYSVGFQNDMSAAGPKGHLTSVLFHWDKYYTPLIKEVAAGNWTSKGLPLSGMELGAADISPLNAAVPADVQEKIEQTREAMRAGTFSPYAGPVKKQNGEIVVAEGAVMDDGGLWGMDYFVEGIIGTMPAPE
jgi:basic membrane lipoprotein Med (substrate-binding protein (PBP1-ABC) superfamily)